MSNKSNILSLDFFTSRFMIFLFLNLFFSKLNPSNCFSNNYFMLKWLFQSKLPSVNFIGNDRSFIHNDVHESQHVGSGFQVKKDRRVPVDYAALGQDGDGDGRRGGHDLSGQLNVDVNNTLQKHRKS